MKLYLFGGAETNLGQAPALVKLINEVLAEIKPKQLLHVPFARRQIPKNEINIWGEGWISRALSLSGTELLDARNEKDLLRAKHPVIFVNGGHDHQGLYQEITHNKLLYKLIKDADYYIGESAGSMIVGTYQRNNNGTQPPIGKGLGILKSTIIEPHYTQRQRHQILKDEMKDTGADYSIGIDSLSAMVIDTNIYPDSYNSIGNGIVELIQKQKSRLGNLIRSV